MRNNTWLGGTGREEQVRRHSDRRAEAADILAVAVLRLLAAGRFQQPKQVPPSGYEPAR